MKNIIFILCFLFIFSCKEDEKPLETLNLSESSIHSDSYGLEKSVKILSNTDWSIPEIPIWCTIDKLSGYAGTDIIILIQANDSYLSREASIKVLTQNSVQYLTISQDGIKKEDSPLWHILPVNSFNNSSFTDGANEGELIFTFEANSLFINSAIKDKIYPGNIISSNAEAIGQIPEFKGFTYNPVTIVTFTNGQTYTKSLTPPSKNDLDLFVSDIIKDQQQENISFTLSSLKTFDSYRQLYLTGMANLGIDLCQVITGKTYQENNMQKSIGLIYGYSMTLFKVIMDYPQKLIQEDLSEAFIKENSLAYINVIEYGTTAFLIVESDNDKKIIDLICSKILKNQELSDYELALINNTEVYYLYFTGDGELHKESGDNIDIIKKYGASINNNEIIPLAFSINNFYDHTVGDIKYSLTLQ